MHKSLTIGIPAITLATIVLSAQVGSAQPAPTATDAATPAKPYCVVRLEQPMECFTTETEATRFGANGHIDRAPNGTATSVDRPTVILPRQVTLYEGINYNGRWLAYYGFCGSRGNLPYFFNDKTSSLKVDYCGVTLYEHANQRGISRYYGPWSNIPYVGAQFNDKASSFSLPYRL